MKTIQKSLLLSLCLSTPSVFAQENLNVKVLSEKDKKNQAILNSLLQEEAAKPKAASSLQMVKQKPKANYIDASLILQAAAGGSTATDTEIAQLQTGLHDPRRRGFTFQAGEFSLSGAVDPYFKAEMHANFSESAVELEEAFITATALPGKTELEAGYFLTEFGRNNPRHSHDNAFVDQALVVGRMFGGEGQRAAGLRVGGILPFSWFSEWHLGMQSPVGGLSPSFRSTATTTIGGRPTVTRDTQSFEDMISLVRLVNGTNLGDNWEAQWGLSAMIGANSTGSEADTTLFGSDLTLRWLSPKQKQGYPYFYFEAEYIQRNFEAAAGVQNGLAYNADDLDDWGYVVQGIYGFAHRWSGGLRFEQAGGKGASFSQLRSADSGRGDRIRISPIISFKPSEFSKTSLQYNYDKADYLTDKSQSSVWLSLEILIGKHPAHNF